MPYRQIGLICPSESVRFLVDYLKKLRFDIRALWTPQPDLTIQAAAEYEIPFCASRPDEVLLRKEVQMIIITGRPHIHSQIAIKALGIGKHVLCDAPVTLNSAEACKMMQAAQYYPQLLALVGYGLRHLKIFRTARDLIADGYIGTPVACEISLRTDCLLNADRYDWLWEYSMGGGVLNLVGCHVIDLITFLTRRRAARVQGLVKCSGGGNLSQNSHSDEIEGTETNFSLNGETSSFTDASDGEISTGNFYDTPCFFNSPSAENNHNFRRVNAEDFTSFLMKFDDDFVATVTLNALCKTRRNEAEKCNNEDVGFAQRIFISGTDGQLEIRENEIYGTRYFSNLRKRSVASANFHQLQKRKNSEGAAFGQPMDLLYKCEDDDEDRSSHIVDSDHHQIDTVVPKLYVNGFLHILRILAEADDQKIGVSWQTGPLSSLASFEDAAYVRAVIDAVRHSSAKCDWVKVDAFQMQQQQEQMQRNHHFQGSNRS